jgi:alkanesulfonate monooxygenase SsuD/methylene tetrahydromethanopterin reductase-like flavin-dependent oxidoreductase (luciferase family)
MAPVKMAQQAQVAAQLSGGRFRLGIGVAGAPAAEGMYGLTYDAPLAHLREYITIIKSLVTTGSVDFQGKYYKASAKLPGESVAMPVMMSALRAGAFKLAGEVADGAITWVTPGSYVRDVAGPALRDAAKAAGREAPAIVLHVPVTVHENIDEVRAQARKQFGFYVRAPHYQKMFIASGFSEAASGDWSDAMIDSVVVSGDEAAVEGRLRELESYGIAEFIASPLAGLGEDRTYALLKNLVG